MSQEDAFMDFLQSFTHLEQVTGAIDAVVNGFKKNTGVAIQNINCEWISHHSQGETDRQLVGIQFEMK